MGPAQSANHGARRPIGVIFWSDFGGAIRVTLVSLAVIVCTLTIVIPLVYIAVVIIQKGTKALKDRIGFDLQPLVLAMKAVVGKPRFSEINLYLAEHKLFLGAQPDIYGGFSPV